MRTHGEAYVHRKNNLDFTHDIDKIPRNFDRLPIRMKREEALVYYGEKLQKVFGIEQITKREFIKVEHYFDYHEAIKLRRKNNATMILSANI